jgi:hypothetical protein
MESQADGIETLPLSLALPVGVVLGQSGCIDTLDIF